MKTVIQTWQPLIQQNIEEIISEFSTNHARFVLDERQLEYLKKMSVQGKQFRGCLLAGFYELMKGNLTDQEKNVVARLAAAIELYGTAILLHDDIIDKSDERRGLASVHRHMEEVARGRSLKEPEHFGVGAAICLADVLFFLADKTVAQLTLPAEMRVQLAAINGEELALLGLAEIEDTRLSSSLEFFPKEDILSMFAGKTGRYTGRWPLHCACVMAEVDQALTEKIVKIGENIGVLYQLKDDELGIFGDADVTGKSTTSDLVDGKKTLYYWYLSQLPEAEKSKVFAVVGNAGARENELEWVKKFIVEKGIREQVSAEIEQMKEKVSTGIAELDIPVESKNFLNEILDFVINRNK